MRSTTCGGGLVLAGLWAFLICACSSSPNKGAMGGAGGGSASGGGGVGAVDAATDLQPRDAATDAPHDTVNEARTSTPQDQACHAAIEAQCQSLVACGYNSVDDCNALAVLCPDYYFSIASTLTVQGVTDCLGDLAKMTCTDWDLQLRLKCVAGGIRAAGAACVHSPDCQSAGCSGRNKVCGTCNAALPATGESCASSSCRPGDFCHRTTKLCTAGSSIVYANMGESCDLSATPVVGCAGSLHCVSSVAGTTAGTCRPPLGNGESCVGAGAICGPSLECFLSTDAGTCQPIPPTPSPQACGDAGVCDDASYCDGAGQHRVCLPRVAVGQVCLPDGGTMLTPCVSPAVCLGSPGICTVYGNLGDACNNTTQPCDGQYLVCLNGRCGTFETSLCPSVPEDAGAD